MDRMIDVEQHRETVEAMRPERSEYLDAVARIQLIMKPLIVSVGALGAMRQHLGNVSTEEFEEADKSLRLVHHFLLNHWEDVK